MNHAPSHLRLVEPTRADLTNSFAEQHQVDPDEAYRDAVYDEIRGVLFGAACGLLVGMSATVGLAYVWSWFL